MPILSKLHGIHVATTGVDRHEISLRGLNGPLNNQLLVLHDFVQANDLAQATAQAHKIKGASANVGGMVLSNLALAMEQAGKSDDMPSLQQHLTALEQSFTQLKSTMEETLS